MKKFLSLLLCFTMLLVMPTLGASAVETDKAQNSSSFFDKAKKDISKEKVADYEEGKAVVMLKDTGLVSSGANLSDILEVSSSVQISEVSNFSNKRNGFSVAEVSSNKLSTKELISELMANDEVLLAEPNYIYKALDVSNDTYRQYQWALDNKGNQGGTVGKDLNADVLDTVESSEKENVVAIIDTGIDPTNEDLVNSLWKNPYPNKLAGTYGYDFTDTNENNDPIDDVGHGTHCAGIIAAEANNNTGIAGVSPNTKIMSLKFITAKGNGDTYDSVLAYNYIYEAMKLGVNVTAVSCSWGGSEDSKILVKVIDMVGQLGAPSICSSGNDSMNLDEEYYNEDSGEYMQGNYPSCSDSDYIVSVGALNEKYELASYSNYSSKYVDIAAPGSDILSTINEYTYNPGIYGDKNNEISAVYESQDFSAEKNSNNFSEKKSVEKTSEVYFGDDKTALKFNGKNLRQESTVSFEIPYTVSDDMEQAPQVSFMIRPQNVPELTNTEYLCQGAVFVYDVPADTKIEDLDNYTAICYSVLDNSDYWYHINYNSENYSNVDTESDYAKERKIILNLAAFSPGDYSFVIDDFGISKGIAGEETSFGKYEFQSGTSMATPYVAGVISLLREKYPNITSQEAVAMVCGSAEQSDNLMGKIAAGGGLNLEKLSTLVPIINSVTTEDNSICINGKNLKNSNLYINDTKINPTSTEDSKIVVKDSSYINKHLSIKIETDNGVAKKSAYTFSGTKYESCGNSECLPAGTVVTSDGTYMYVFNDEGELCRLEESSEENQDEDFVDLSFEDIDDFDVITESKDALSVNKTYDIDYEKLFPEANLYFSSGTDITNGAYYGGFLYYVVDLNYITNAGTPYKRFSRIIKVNTNSGDITTIDYDYENIQYPSIALYNNSLYLIGGVDINTGNVLNTTQKYNENSKLWEKSANLPSGRALGQCQQVGNTLVYTLGTDGTEDTPQNLLFNGTTWTQSKAKVLVSQNSQLKVFGNDEISFTDSNIDLATNALLYTGVVFEGFGDTVLYNVEKDEFESINRHFIEDEENDNLFGGIINNKFYGMNLYDDIISGSQTNDVYSFPIDSGMYNITATADHGKVTGTGLYMPGSTVKITATANIGYSVKSITVNGKTTNGNTVSFTSSQSLTVKVNYNTLVTKVKLNKSSATLTNKGDKLRLKATITPSKASNQSVVWKSSNTKVAKVSAYGLVTAVGKGTAKITATAKDGSKKYATCKITVKQQVTKVKLNITKKTLQKKGDTVQLKATCTPSNANNKKVKWKSSNSKVAKVSATGKVTAVKKGKVTITCTAADTSKVSAKCIVTVSR